MPLQTAVVLGATGLTGGCVLKELLNDDAFAHVTVLVRRSFVLMHPKLSVKPVDFTDVEDFADKLGHGNVIFSCIGTTQKKVNGDAAAYRAIDYDIPVNAAVLGRLAGYNTFVLVSAIGANTQSANFYLKLKGEVDEAVSSAGIASVNIFRPSFLLGNRGEFRLGESVIKPVAQAVSFLLWGGWKKYRAIKAASVAKAMVAAAKNAVPGSHIYEYDHIMRLAGGK